MIAAALASAVLVVPRGCVLQVVPLRTASALVALLSGGVSATDSLPAHMTGKWDGRLTDGRPVYWTWTVEITKQNVDGSLDAIVDVSGGVNCFTRKRHTTGKYEGTVLILNIPRAPRGQCRDLTLELRPTPAHLFEGAGASTMRDVRMYLDRTPTAR
jgi:hypothetical protein